MAEQKFRLTVAGRTKVVALVEDDVDFELTDNDARQEWIEEQLRRFREELPGGWEQIDSRALTTAPPKMKVKKRARVKEQTGMERLQDMLSLDPRRRAR